MSKRKYPPSPKMETIELLVNKRDELQAELAEARAENARLKYLLDLGHSGLIKELKDAEADNARLREALNVD